MQYLLPIGIAHPINLHCLVTTLAVLSLAVLLVTKTLQERIYPEDKINEQNYYQCRLVGSKF